MRFTAYDRWDSQKGTLENVIEAVHEDEPGALDTLTITMPSCDLIKGDRVVWRDKFLEWHEHVVTGKRDVHEDGKTLVELYCENSMVEMLTDHVDDLRPYGVAAATAMDRVLQVTRWARGTVTITGTATASLYHTSALEALQTIQSVWGGELSATITVQGTKVVGRAVNLTVRGEDNGKRFEWTKDMTAIVRDVDDSDVITALYGYGKGLEVYDADGQLTGGYERRLKFGEINGGLDYVYDGDAKAHWGLPDGNGGIKHAFGRVIFPDCEDMAELKALTKARLDELKQPRVSYTMTVLDLADFGYEYEDVRAGDVVQIVDAELWVRARGRVVKLSRHLMDEGATRITIGNVAETVTSVLSAQRLALDKLASHASAWDNASSNTAQYVAAVIAGLNSVINQTGGYTYIVEGEGIRTYDRPVTDPSVGAEATAVVEIKGGTIRIANSKTSQGAWNWKSVFTSGHIAAELVTAAHIVAGYIGSVNSGNYWDLDNGTLTTKNMNAVNMTATGKITSEGTAYDVETSSNVPYVGKLSGGRLQTYYNEAEVGTIKASKLAAAYINGIFKTNVLGMLFGYESGSNPLWIMESPEHRGIGIRAGLGSTYNEVDGSIDLVAKNIFMLASGYLDLMGTIRYRSMTTNSNTYWVKDTDGNNHLVIGPFFMS